MAINKNRQTTIGVGHDGKPLAADLKPHMPATSLTHGLGQHAEGHAEPGNIARDGAPKRVGTIKLHDGMHFVSAGGQLFLGGRSALPRDASGANPLDPSNAKTLTPPQVHPAMINRTSPK